MQRTLQQVHIESTKLNIRHEARLDDFIAGGVNGDADKLASAQTQNWKFLDLAKQKGTPEIESFIQHVPLCDADRPCFVFAMSQFLCDAALDPRPFSILDPS